VKKITSKSLTILDLLFQNIRLMVSRQYSFAAYLEIPTPPTELATKPRSLFIRHLDCGSCNGCELALNALTNPVYDIEQYGIRFAASPRHADIVAMTGPFTRKLEQAASATLAAMPEPNIIAIGDCAKDGGIFRNSTENYAIATRPSDVETVIRAYVSGCPPTPSAILDGLLHLDLPSPTQTTSDRQWFRCRNSRNQNGAVNNKLHPVWAFSKSVFSHMTCSKDIIVNRQDTQDGQE